MNLKHKNAEVLHIVEHEKFIPPFIELVNKNLNPETHHFYFIHNGHKYPAHDFKNLTLNAEPKNIIRFIWNLRQATIKPQKIILHGLFSTKLMLALVLQPWLLKKCYWVIWGGDLYTHIINDGDWRWKVKEFFRHILIPKIGNLITYIPGDIELARQWYGAKGIHHKCIMYPSNTFQSLPQETTTKSNINILLGNSADSSNNHEDIIYRLTKTNTKNFLLYCPLSYGEKDYAQKIVNLGTNALGDRFIGLRNFIPHSEYIKFLSNIDIAIFNHRRQQAMGNMISLLGMGKKVLIRTDISTWSFLQDIGVVVYDVDKLELSTIPKEISINNIRIIKNTFSIDTLLTDWKTICEQ